MFQKHPPIITMSKAKGNTSRGLRAKIRKGSAQCIKEKVDNNKATKTHVDQATGLALDGIM